MKSIFKQFLTCCGVSLYLASGIAHAEQATIPNTFSSGAPANAADVNENFSSMKTAIDDNDTRIAQSAKRFVAVDVNDTEIGIIIGGKLGKVFIRSPQGFVGRVFVTNGRISSGYVYFTDADCGSSNGVAHLDFYNASHVPGSVFDIVGNSGAPGGLLSPEVWYMPKPATLLDSVAVLSVRKWDFNTNSVICAAAPVTLTTAARIFPNDTVVTGFPNAAFPAPVTVEYR